MFTKRIRKMIDYKLPNGDYIFNYKLIGTGNLIESLDLEINKMKLIESNFPNIFNWRFDGKDLECYAIIPTSRNKYIKTLTRFGGINNFISTLSNHLKRASGTSGINRIIYPNITVLESITPFWEINTKTGLYCVPINPTDGINDILKESSNPSIKNIYFKELDLIKITSELTPENGYNQLRYQPDRYPDCIVNIMNKPTKSQVDLNNLIRYFLSVHSLMDTKKLFNIILTDKEKRYMETCKVIKRIDYIFNNLENVGCPNCNNLKTDCNNCGKFHPLQRC